MRTGDNFWLHLTVQCLDDRVVYSATYPFPEFRVGTWVETIPGGRPTVYTVLTVVLLPGAVFLIYLLAPAWIVWLRTSPLSQAAEELPGYISWIPKILVGYLLLPWLGTRPRVLDAWVDRNAARFSEVFESRTTVKQRGDRYVSLPVHVTGATESELIPQPAPGTLHKYLGTQVVRAVIVGAGGSGKTRLGIEIVRWCLDAPSAHLLGGFRRVPLLLDEDITDIAATVTDQLRAIAGNVDADLQRALLTSGRLLLLADRFSEQNEATRKQILNLTRSLNAAALIVTSRTPLDLQVPVQTDIAIKPLDAQTLPMFLTGLASQSDGIVQLVILTMAVALFRIAVTHPEAKEQPQISPLLAKMFFELSATDPGAALDSAATSLPEIYFRYVLRLDAAHEAANRVSEANLRRICVEIGRRALTSDHRPGDFWYDEVQKGLHDKGLWQDGTDVIDRLKEHGILRSKPIGTRRMLRFELDTMAETFWLFGEAEASGSDKELWSELVMTLRKSPNATSLIDALQSIHASYAEAYKWPPFPKDSAPVSAQ